MTRKYDWISRPAGDLDPNGPSVAALAGANEPDVEGGVAAKRLVAQADARLVAAQTRPRFWTRARFGLLIAAALLLHAAIIAAFLERDRQDTLQVVQAEETPVEIVVEKPPPPVPEKKQPAPEKPPPKPKEDLSMAKSAPRAPNEDTLKTERMQPKTSVPKAPQPPSEGTPQPRPQIAQPKEAAPPQSKEDTAAKEEDKRPDAEALDKAKPKVAPETKTKAAKAAPKQKKAADLMASLAGSSALPELSFSKPAPKSKVYGGTEDVRWMSTVEGMLEAKVSQLPRTVHWQAGGQVLICFHVDEAGRVTVKEFCRKSGYPDVDQLAMRALLSAAPFPPPPAGVEHGLVWSSVFDGQLPSVHVSKR